MQPLVFLLADEGPNRKPKIVIEVLDDAFRKQAGYCLKVRAKAFMKKQKSNAGMIKVISWRFVMVYFSIVHFKQYPHRSLRCTPFSLS